MSIPRNSASCVVLSAFALILLGSGCSGPGYRRAEAKVESMKAVKESIDKGKAQIGVTLKSLDQIVASANSDPRPAFDQYVKDLKTLDSLAADARDRATALRARAEEHFSAWEKEKAGVKNPELARLSDERRAKAKEVYEGLQKESQAVKDLYALFSQDLHDIQTYLGSNLNAAGVAAGSNTFTKAKEDGAKVTQSLDGLNAKLTEIATELSPVTAQPAPTPQAK